MAVPITARVHPVVLFSIVDAYERRNAGAQRVIGTLLGAVETGGVEVTNCFTVPHTEGDDVAVDMDFAHTMYELHRQVNKSEVVVGWFSTGADVTEHSLLIHEFYARENKNPVHLTVDTSLQGGHLGMAAYISAGMGVPGKQLGTIFTPVAVETACYEPERVGLDFISQAKFSMQRCVSMSSDLSQVKAACKQLQAKLETVLKYVDEVVSGDLPADNLIGRQLLKLVESIPKTDPEAFQRMLSDNMKDLLMVMYLSNLTKSQLALNEKLSYI